MVALEISKDLKGCPLRRRACSFSPVLAEDASSYPEDVAFGMSQ